MQVELNTLEPQIPDQPAQLNKTYDTVQHTSPDSSFQSQSVPKKDSPPPSHAYRPEVDGLRAVAIISVLIYHAFPEAIPGGFIGVDVFFVISGFLISGIIIKQIQKGKFSFVDFYCRRVKRIYPVLILTLSFALYVISQILDQDLRIFSLNTVDSSLIFGTNIQILMHKKGYFDRDIRNNPLLHLWSLGVEEQFYIIWPVLLIVIFKFFKKQTLPILIGYTLLSFAFSIFSIYQSTKFAFYFPLCRFWQMASGGILSYLDIKIRSKLINNVLSNVGLALIVVGCYVMDDDSFFPGFLALIPTAGAILIIQARNESFINSKILSSSICLWIGKISYSLYLWHWPLLVFSWLFFPKGSTSILSNTYFIIFLTVLASFGSYFTVEDRIRKIKGKKIVILLLILMGVIGIVSIPLRYSLENQKSEALKSVDEDMTPTFDDYVKVNGKLIPNLSYNKNRLPVNSIMKIQASKFDQDNDVANGGEHLLEKVVDINSKYNIPRPELTHYEVANEGKKNQLFIIGDSHAKKTSFRFQELHRQSVAANTTDSFPTILAVVREAWQLTQGNYLLNYTRQIVKEFKPQRIFFQCNWLCYICKNLDEDLSNPTTNCSQEFTVRYIDQFVNFVKQIQSQGVEVITTKIDINNIQLSPAHMFDLNGVIQKNVEPFKYSDFKKKFKSVIDYYETSLTNANITMIDMADNLCYNDLCHVVSPKGYAVFVDRDHFGKFYAKHWVTVVDDLVKFDKA